MSEQQVANPEPADDIIENAVFGSAEGFFDDLDREVNGAIRTDEEPKENQNATEQSKQDNPLFTDIEKAAPKEVDTDWEKRYSDSSREAQRLKDELDDLDRFKPYIEALHNDDGLVNVIRDYVQDGQKPKELKEELNLPEDFVFDIEDAVQNPSGDSARVFSGMIDRAVDGRVSSKLSADNDARTRDQMQIDRERQAKEFRSSRNIGDDEFNEMMGWANKHQINFEDIYLLKNKDAYMSNVANSTKEGMLKQMKAVRDIPTSAGATNSQSRGTDPNDAVFDAILGMDNQVDNLFS